MNKSGFRYLKVTAVVAVLAITIIGLSGLLSATTIAQEKRTEPPREIDLHAKLKDKKFADGRRVVIDTLDSGEKFVAEVKAGKLDRKFRRLNPRHTVMKYAIYNPTKDKLTCI